MKTLFIFSLLFLLASCGQEIGTTSITDDLYNQKGVFLTFEGKETRYVDFKDTNEKILNSSSLESIGFGKMISGDETIQILTLTENIPKNFGIVGFDTQINQKTIELFLNKNISNIGIVVKQTNCNSPFEISEQLNSQISRNGIEKVDISLICIEDVSKTNGGCKIDGEKNDKIICG